MKIAFTALCVFVLIAALFVVKKIASKIFKHLYNKFNNERIKKRNPSEEQPTLSTDKDHVNSKLFNKKSTELNTDPPKDVLYFKSSEAAFEFIDKYSEFSFDEGKTVIGLVTRQGGGQDGNQVLEIKLPGKKSYGFGYFLNNAESTDLTNCLCFARILSRLEKDGVEIFCLAVTQQIENTMSISKGWKIRKHFLP